MYSDLEPILTSMASEIEWPEPSTGFAQRVIARIESQPVPHRGFPRWTAALAAGAALVAAILVFSPATREAVADLLGIGGVQIEYVAPRDLPTPAPGGSLDLGHPVTVAEAREVADFPVVVPKVLGEPDQVWFDTIVPKGMVSLVYLARPDLPGAAGTDVAVLITEFRGDLARGQFFKKMVATSTVETVDVNGAEGYWITGSPHSFFFEQDDRVIEETVRLVENVLLWVQDGVTLRIETAGSLHKALRIAESLD
ncbi:MAG: hypothetical protein QOG16_996 [Actinomycetota bacterium]|nr:hypothetical protein [Actinomycetota bacterium]